jgi:mannose-1-phosphate guanylyltransferase
LVTPRVADPVADAGPPYAEVKGLHLKFVIRAGGVGTRLWPYSRKKLPKQFHALVGDRSMLQDALDRISPIADPADIFISTGAEQVDLVKKQLPDFPADQIIIEPALRNTGPAVGLECVILESRFPGCTVASLGSDHHIHDSAGFCHLLEAAEKAVEQMPEALLTLGVTPTRPETGFGYIRKGPQLAEYGGEPVYKAERFTEKPDLDTARAFLAEGGYLWNSNMFIWKAQTVLGLLEAHEPDIHSLLMQIRSALGTPEESDTIERLYPAMPSVAIDNAVVERASTVATVEADIGWSDIGTWQAIPDVLPTDEDGNSISGDVLNLDSHNVTVYGRPGRLVAIVDAQDLIVVDTEDAILVCPRESAQRVKDVVAKLEQDPDRARFT